VTLRVLGRYCGDFVCSIRHGHGNYSLKPFADAAAGNIEDGSSVKSAGDTSSRGAPEAGSASEDSAAGLFISNSFVCGAVARALKRVEEQHALPQAFTDFFRAFWGHQMALAEDGVQLPGHVAKFLPIISTAADFMCSNMWSFAFDGGAPAACHAAASTMARAPFCGRYIEEVLRICCIPQFWSLMALATGWPSRAAPV
jgi:hypothetical protein